MEKENLEKLLLKTQADISRARRGVEHSLFSTFYKKDVDIPETLVVVFSEEDGYKPIEVFVTHVKYEKSKHTFGLPRIVYTTDNGYEYDASDVLWQYNLYVVEAYVESLEEPKLYAMPIDNKHILEDFTDDFHDREFTECRKGELTCQTFWMNECVCLISYHFGLNWARFEVINGSETNSDKTMKEVDKIIETYRENLVVKVVAENDRTRKFSFYKSEDQL